jgi:hypothetical protein
MKLRPAFCLVLCLLSLGLVAGLRAAPADADLSALDRGTLEVWAPTNYPVGRMNEPTARVIRDYQWSFLLNEFRRDFPDFDLRFKIMDRGDFVRSMRSAAQNSPDLAFVDNQSERGPLQNDNAIVEMAGRSRFAYNGWWVMFRNARNPEAAKAFLLWLSQSPRWKPWHVSTATISQADMAAVQAVSKQAVQDFEQADSQSLSSVMDRSGGHFIADFGQFDTLDQVDPLITFGNSRLAFVLVSAQGRGLKVFGMTHSALILRKAEGQWKVLLFLQGDLPGLEESLRSLDRLNLGDGQPETMPAVTLRSPIDHAQIPRYPASIMGWETVDAPVSAYVLEYQYGLYGRENWSPSSIKILPPRPGQQSMNMPIPFGVGVQPHRWRVWAIGKNGGVSISGWRTIDFTR